MKEPGGLQSMGLQSQTQLILLYFIVGRIHPGVAEGVHWLEGIVGNSSWGLITGP